MPVKIQESFENLTEYYLCKGIFLCFSLIRKILHKHKIKKIKQRALGHLKGTQGTLGHLGDSGTLFSRLLMY